MSATELLSGDEGSCDGRDFRRALDAHSIVSVADAAGRIVEVNDLFCEISGYSAEELIGQDHRLVNSGLHSKEFFADMWRTIAAGSVWHGTLRNRRKDGRHYWVKTTIAPCFDATGRVRRYMSIRTDVTALVEAQQAALCLERDAQQAQQIQFQIIEGTPVPTFVIDAGHAITHWNKACETITSVKAAAIIGKHDPWRTLLHYTKPVLADLIVDETVEAYLAGNREDDIHRSAAIPGAYEGEIFVSGVGDGGTWLFLTAAPLRDLAGRIIGAVQTIQDVTERKATEAALREASSELERLVEKRTGQLVQANALLAEDMRRREVAEAELQRRYDDLSELNARLRGVQEQLLHAEKMASIGQLAAGVAHEINNPIGFVNSNLGSLERYLGEVFRVLDAYAAVEPKLVAAEADVYAGLQQVKAEVDLDFLREDLKALLEESKDGIARVRKIVQDLKDFSRAEGAEDWQLADLRKGLDSTLNMVNNEIKYKADVVKDYGDLPEIECLPSQLNQVFMNLLINAAQAMPAGKHGQITLRTGALGERVWVEVTDTGSGIAPEYLKRIFDPFFTTKPVGQGTGLGLSLSYGIVKKHGGEFEVGSEVGKGTTFRITLPVQRTDGVAQ